jgi:chromosome segregation ATPase
MANQAIVTSTEALESFRASLIVFLAKARRSVDDASDEVRRTRQWLQQDQRAHWEGEFRRRTKQLEQARQELMSVRLASHQESALMARQVAVAKAQRDLAEAEGKLRKLKSWNQNFDTSADPIIKRMEKLRQALNDLPKAIAYLVSVQKTLEAYAESAGPPPSPTPSSEPSASLEPEGQPQS